MHNKEELLKRKKQLESAIDDLDMSSDCGSMDHGDYYGYRRELDHVNYELRKIEEEEKQDGN